MGPRWGFTGCGIRPFSSTGYGIGLEINQSVNQSPYFIICQVTYKNIVEILYSCKKKKCVKIFMYMEAHKVLI